MRLLSSGSLRKYAWAKTLKDKKANTVLYGFIEIVSESKRKPRNCGLIKEKKL